MIDLLERSFKPRLRIETQTNTAGKGKAAAVEPLRCIGPVRLQVSLASLEERTLFRFLADQHLAVHIARR